jgi:hypothetical protein
MIMFNFADAWRAGTRPVVLTLCLAALGVGSALAQTAVHASPDALLAVDQNRATVIERIVADWGAALAQSNAGIDAGQLRHLLQGMRADYLLAASLAGSVDGLRQVIAGTLPSGKAGVGNKILGDTADDLVYTPVTPCRLVETRGTFAAVYQGDGTAAHNPVPFATNQIRNYTLQGGNGVCLTQLPAGLNPSAVQLQVFGIPLSAATSGDIEMLPQGAAFGSTATLIYLGSEPFVSASATVKSNLANNQIGVQVRGGGANLAVDVVGYFAPPVATALSCLTVASASTAIPVSSDTLVALPACTAGYTRTGASCAGTSGVPGGYLIETNTSGCLFRNLSAVSPYNATATSTCCRIPGR